MPEPRLVSIVGKKNSGKTTLVVALVRELVRRGHRTMTIKHGAHPFEIDEQGKDTWRHIHEGGAERVVMESPEARVLIAHTTNEMGPRETVLQYGDPDVLFFNVNTADDLARAERLCRSLDSSR